MQRMISGKKKNKNMKKLMTSVPQDAVTQKKANQFEARPGPRRGGGVRATNPDCDTLPLVISVFQNERDNKPLRVDLTWSQMLGQYFKRHWINKSKVGGQAMSPVSYKPSYSRGNAGIDQVCCAVFDIEHHGSFDDLRARLDGYAFVAHSSYRHTTEDPRFRIILPLTKPVPASEWADAWERLNQWLGGINDPATKDAARLYYLPSQPPDAPDHFIVVGGGRALDISELPEAPPERRQTAVATTSRSHPKIKIDGIEDIPPDPLNPAEGLERVVARCKFMAEASQPEAQKSASRAIWMALVSNASRFESSEEWIHAASCHHDEYDESQTDKLIQSCRNFGSPITCRQIQDGGYAGCPSAGCNTASGKVTRAPAGLWMKSGTVVSEHCATDQLAISEKSPFSGVMPGYLSDFIDQNYPSGLIFSNERFLGYRDGYWKELEDRADVRHKIALFFGKSANAKSISDTFKMLMDFLAVSDAKLGNNKNLICLRNGTLDTDTYQLLQHSPDHGLTYRTDIEWDANAECGRWVQFLDEIFVNDADKAQKMSFLQEWFGYCLIPDASQHKFVWMVGSGGNGKSVLLTLLTALAGPPNVSHAYMDRLDRPAVRAELEGKLINISSEMSAESTIADGYLKAIVAGDMLEAEKKFKPPYSFRPFVRLIGATNNLPRLLDLSDGFFRRAIVLTFNRQFSGDEVDHSLEGRLLTELQGILAWSIRGLHRLRERGHFEIPQSSIDALANYRQESDQVLLFSQECLEQIAEGGMQASTIYNGYSRWCNENGFSRKNIGGLGRRLKELGFVSYRSAAGSCWRVKEKSENGYLWGVDDIHSVIEEPVPVSTHQRVYTF